MLLAVIAGGAEAQEATVSGIFQIVYGDPFDPSFSPVTLYFVTDDAGITTQIEATREAFGEFTPQQLLGQRVTVSGNRVRPDTVSAISVIPEDAAAVRSQPEVSITGSQKWLTLLCRFGDMTGITPHPKTWFETLMGSAYPGMDDYWQELSFDQINLAGSGVFGWYDLPDARSVYFNTNGSFKLTQAAQDCTTAANTADDSAIFFPNYMGINLMFNADLDCCAWGGSRFLTLDGQTKTYSVTWLPPWGYENQSVTGHEMGHGFGLPHSSGPYGQTYDSCWDVMSTGDCVVHDPEYGWIAVHTISYHKDLLGWIPADRKFEPSLGSETQIELRALDGPVPSVLANQYLMAEIPIPGTNDFYTVEARLEDSYDVGIPTALILDLDGAVIIHKVNPDRSDSNAQVVDATLNDDPNDAGAQWIAGETFTDTANGITIAIDQATAGGFLVTIKFLGENCQGETITISGTAGKNTLIGTAGPDVIDGKGGNDKIDGKGGDDIICGGAGNDKITGGDGNDSIEGEEGNDKIDGGNGNDDLSGQAGKDNIKGGEGEGDLDGGAGKDQLDGGGGADTCINGEKVKGCEA